MDSAKQAMLVDIIREGDINKMRIFYAENPTCLSVQLSSQGRYAIHYAAREGNLDLVRFMIVKGPAHLELMDNNQQTPLLHAVYKGRTEVVKYLLSKGANYLARTVNSDLEGNQRTVIEWALKFEYAGCLKALHLRQLKDMQYKLTQAKTNRVALYNHLMIEAIESQNSSALNYLLLETNHLNDLDPGLQFHLLEKANAILSPERLMIFLVPRVIAQLNTDNGSLLEIAIKNKLNNLVSLMVLNTDVSGYHEYNEQFISLASASSDSYIHNILIVVLFQRFLELEAQNQDKPQSKWRPEDLFVSYLKSGQQVIELAAMDGRLIPYLIAAPHVQMLIEEDKSIESSLNARLAYYPRNIRRPFSIFAEIKPSSLSIFLRKKILGKGVHGMVCAFESQHGDSVAVKEVFDASEESVRQEAIFGEILHSNKPTHAFFRPEFDRRGLIEQKRIVMPYFAGVVLSRANDLIRNTVDFADLILKLSQKLLSFHARGCIHGDINANNFLISRNSNGFEVEVVDFGLSFYQDQAITRKLQVAHCESVAPELTTATDPSIPHPRTDIYSLGYMLISCIHYFSIEGNLLNDFPVIQAFCAAAIKKDPLERPQSLKAFCAQLAEELELVRSVSMAPSSSM